MDIPLPPSPPRPSSGAVEYSPSHVTSPQTDEDDDYTQNVPKFDKKFENVAEEKKITTPAPPPTKSTIVIDLKRNPKVLGTARVANLLSSYKATKPGSISMDLAKPARTRIPKLKNFDDDETEQTSNSVHQATNPSGFSKEKETKKPSKLNIDSIIEEDIAEKAKQYYPAVVPPVALPLGLPGVDAAIAAATRRVEVNITSGGMATKLDNMGFVTSLSAQKAIEEKKEREKSDRSRKDDSKRRRSRSRDRRSRSRERRSSGGESAKRRRSRSPQQQQPTEEEIPFDVKEMPASWKECKEKQVDVTHAAFAKFKASLTASSTASAEDKESAANKRLMTLVKKRGEPKEWLDPFTEECEKVSAEKTGKKEDKRRSRAEQFDKDYKYVEFPIAGVRKTTCKPSIQWSMNPKYGISSSYLTRGECLEEMGDHVKVIVNAKPKTDPEEAASEQNCPPVFVKEENFLDDKTTQFETKEERVESVPEESEMAVEEEKKKKKKKGKKKSKETGGADKSKKDKSKKKKRKKDKKEKTDEDQAAGDEAVEEEEDRVSDEELQSDVDESRNRRKEKKDSSSSAKKQKKLRDEEGGDDVEMKKSKKKKKNKRRKNAESCDDGDDASPLQDEHTPSATPPTVEEEALPGLAAPGLSIPSSGLANIGTWEDPMKVVPSVETSSHFDDKLDVRSRRDSSRSSAKGPTTTSGFGTTDNVVDKLLNMAGYSSSTSGREDRKRRGRSREDERGSHLRGEERGRSSSPHTPARRSAEETPPSDPRLRRSGPRTPSRSPPPPSSGSRHRQGPRTPSPTLGDSRRPRHRHHSRSPVSTAALASTSSPKRRHELVEPHSRRSNYDTLPSPRRYGTSPPPQVAADTFFPERNPEHRRPTSSSGRERSRRSPSPRYSSRYRERRYSPSYRHRGSPLGGDRRRSRSPHYYRRGGHSPHSPSFRRRSPSPARHHIRHDYPLRSVPGGDLSIPSHPPEYYGNNPEHDYRSTLSVPQGLNSPKRLPLDERLEKELGIKVHEEMAPDFSRPPPGFPFAGQRMGPSPAAPPHVNVHLQPGQQIVPTVNAANFHQPPVQRVSKPDVHGYFPAGGVPVPAVAADPPEEGRLVRIGNMLQIVPEVPSTYVAPTMAPVPAPSIPSIQDDSGQQAAILRKMEELKSQNAEKQRLKREKRINDRLSSKQQLEQLAVDDLEPDHVASERILETIEKEEEEDLEAREARLLEEAISSVPEMDEEEEVRDPMAQHHIEDIQAITFSDKNRRRSKTSAATDVRYISLKPLARKERRRQQRLICQMEEEEENADDNYVPRSPVPLPDVSTCKPILVWLGANSNTRAKKTLRYADGVIPGQGSPDHTDEKPDDDDDDESPPQAEAEPKPKRRKRIRLRVIQVKSALDSSDSDSGEIPGPPPGSPPLLHTQQLIELYASRLNATTSLVTVT